MGCCYGSRMYRVDYGYYWSSALNENYPNYAGYLFFDSDYVFMDFYNRNHSQSVRLIKSK